jgi:hypothetical protein
VGMYHIAFHSICWRLRRASVRRITVFRCIVRLSSSRTRAITYRACSGNSTMYHRIAISFLLSAWLPGHCLAGNRACCTCLDVHPAKQWFPVCTKQNSHISAMPETREAQDESRVANFLFRLLGSGINIRRLISKSLRLQSIIINASG